MKTIEEKINGLNDLVIKGRALEAFEMYYHQDVSMQENENEPTVGKDENRKREEEFFASIIDFKACIPKKVAVGKNVSMVEWHYNYIHKDWGKRIYNQISVQLWKDGMIINEKFYYNS
ncbi:SnoaL-like domain-containing protein [Gaetbulibacter sp. M235]|uniref:SnoaL-like domain-containing protein n=1 Tax=Gaetbulibacter sp. M235 TaxID=3126510 RepID=UPI00374E3E8B